MSEMLVNCCCALVPKNRIDLVSLRSISLIAVAIWVAASPSSLSSRSWVSSLASASRLCASSWVGTLGCTAAASAGTRGAVAALVSGVKLVIALPPR